MFPDPSTSPARYAVAHLEVRSRGWVAGESSSLTPFHGFSPTIRSLHISFTGSPPPCLFDLILLFPLLENLAVATPYTNPASSGDGSDELPIAAQPLIPPVFTGSLELCLRGAMKPITRRLLSLPNSIHFRELTLMQFQKDNFSMIIGLVEGCSHTLESLGVTWCFFGESIQHLCPYRQPNSVPRRSGVSFDRPLESNETQRCGVSTHIMERRMDHQGTPDHHTATSVSSTIAIHISYPSIITSVDANVRQTAGEANCRE